MTYKFYDTSSLLLLADEIFEQNNDFMVISSITLQELEYIKDNQNKSVNIKYAARTLLKKLKQFEDQYICIIYQKSMERHIAELDINNDAKIIACVKEFFLTLKPNDSIIFYINDIHMDRIARAYCPNEIEIQFIEINQKYTGYIDVSLTDTDMALFYENRYTIPALINQYINIFNSNNELVDTVCFTGEKYRPLKYKTLESDQLGNIKPIKDDIYQAMAVDSLLNNQITMLRGPSGAGKSHLALGYLFFLLEHNRIDKIIVFCNTVATKNAAKLGYYPGDKNEKLLDSQIGNMLSSKLGGQEAVLRLIEENKLILLPMSDIRGYDTSGMNAGIYITEAQNLDITLAKLALQRVGEDCIMILDGDTESQVDLAEYDGINNGMRRISKIFRNNNFYGEVTLKQIHRSKIAMLANQL